MEMVPKPSTQIQQDTVNQPQPETTAKVAFSMRWAKNSYWFGSQRQGNNLKRPVRFPTTCSRQRFPP